MLIFLLKELFRNYIANGSSMYVTMLDASKAFDKVNHSKLFGKLIDRGCPAFIDFRRENSIVSDRYISESPFKW